MSRKIDSDYIMHCIKEWGNHCSVAFFDPACQFFKHPEINGVIGFRTYKNIAVMFGDPATALNNQIPIFEAFKTFCNEQNKRIVCIESSQSFIQQLLAQKLCHSAITVGNKILLDAAIDPKAHRGGDGTSLRNKWRYSIRRGLMVHEYKEHDPFIEQQLEKLHHQWHAQRTGAQIYLAQTELFNHRTNRRWFYATYQNSIVGLLMLTTLNAQKSYVINFLMLSPDAPTTTSEFMIMSVLEQLAQEGAVMLSAGLIPQECVKSIHGFGSLSQLLIKQCYRIIHKKYKLYRKDEYWRKSAPQKKELFVLFERSRIRISEILGILHALHAL
jgi:lysylphosphatidylglycerol synthetase-like protein (DUF2156 family)